MARKKAAGKKNSVRKTPVKASDPWLAAVAALTLARKNGKAKFGEWRDEGMRWRAAAGKFVSEGRADARAHVRGLLMPARARLEQRVDAVGAALQSGMAHVLARLGIPTRDEMDDLSKRVATLSQRLKSVK